MMRKTNKRKTFSKELGMILESKWFTLGFIAISFLFLLTVRLHVNNAITGDEPHYLLMDYSLAHDHDLNLKNNYQNNDSASFYPGLSPTLQVGEGQGEDNSNRWYSIHGIGLPILLLPGFLLAGKAGAIISMVFFAVLTVWLTKVWVFTLTKSNKLAFLSALGLLVMYSFNGLAGYIYPDVVIAALTLAALILIERYYNKSLYQGLVGLVAGFLTLIHFKALALSLTLIFLLIYKGWRREHKIPWPALIVFSLLIVYFFVSNHGWFGVWNPTKIYSGLDFADAKPPTIVSGFLFDAMRGLLIYNPILLLIFVGLPIWYRRSRETFLASLIVTVPSIIALATFKGWQGGDSQIGRYAIDFLPILFPAIGFAIYGLKRGWQRVFVSFLFLLTIFVTIISVLIKRPYVRHDLRSPFFVEIEKYFNFAFDRLLPTFSEKNILLYSHGLLKIVIGYFILALLVLFGFTLSRSMNPINNKK